MNHAHKYYLRSLLCICCVFSMGLPVHTANAKNLPVEEDEKDEDEDDCKNSKEGADNESLGYYINFGGIPFVEDLEKAQISLHKLKPSPVIHKPQGLYYSSPASQYVMTVDGATVMVRQSDGKAYAYQFSSGASMAKPTNQPRSRKRLERVDVNLAPITSGTPAYYIEHHSNGDALIFDAVSYAAIEYHLASGLTVDFAASSLEVIYNTDTPTGTGTALPGAETVLRQIKSFQGLADIVTNNEDASISDETYEIRLYDYANIGTKIGDYYVPTGAPYKKYVIGNPDPANHPGDLNRIRITEIHGNRSIETNFRYDSGSEQWSMDTGNGLKRLDKYVYRDPASNKKYFVRAMLDASDNVVSKTYNVTKDFAWGSEIVRSVDDPDGFALTTYTEFYTHGNGRGQRKSERYPGGSWNTFKYDEHARLISNVSPWKDSAFDSNANLAHEVIYDYTPLSANDTVSEYDSRPRTRTTKILGIPSERTFYVHAQAGTIYSEIEERAKTQSAAYGEAGNLRTTTTYYDATLGTIAAGRVHTVAIQAVGDTESSLETYSYAYDPASADARFTETVVYGTVASPAGIAYKTMKVEKVYTFQNLLKSEKTYLYTGTGYELLSTVTHGYDDLLNRISISKDGRITYEANYVDGVLDWEKDEAGTQTFYTYDALDRVTTMTQAGATENSAFEDQSNIITIYDRELGAITCGCDGIVITTRQSADGLLSLSSKTRKDKVGRISEHTDEAGLFTSYDYAAGGRITNTYQADTSTLVSENYLDGSRKSLTGTGAIHQFHDKGINSDGTIWERVRTGAIDSPRYHTVTYDFLGRVMREESPAYGSSEPFTVELFYNDRGLLSKRTEPGKKPTLFEYDSVGEVVRSGLDVDGDAALTPASMDRIADTPVQYESHDGAYWKVSKTILYPVDNDATAVVVAETRERTSGFTGNLAQEVRSYDVNGHVRTQTLSTDRATKTMTNVVETADSTIPAVSYLYNGRLVEANTNTVAAPTQFRYDDLGRQTGVKDPRHTQFSSIAYDPLTGQVQSQSDAAGNATVFTYYGDQELGAGQVKSQKNALDKYAYFAYDALGRKTQTWGDTEYPTEMAYDPVYGELTALKTWRDKNDSIDFTTSAWPDPSASSSDDTSWIYDPATGLLTRKEYDDGKGTEYTYTSANQLHVRSWARGITTTYGYDPDTGDTSAVDYSDDTADIGYGSYDRLGRVRTITDATGSRTLTFDPANLRKTKEILAAAYFGGRILTRLYEDGSETYGLAGRSAGFKLGISGALDVDSQVDYAYKPEGRLHSVTQAADVFTYAYEANSNLIDTLTAPVHTTTYTYEANRDLKTNIENLETVSTSSLVSNYAYRYNAIGMRSDVVNTGSAFAQAELSKWSYNDRMEINLQQRFQGTDPEAPGTAEPDEDFTYTYDKIGNRITSQDGTATQRSYSANGLNQYTSISNPSASPQYDDDGNMLRTGSGWWYQWNGENRLIEADNYNRDITAAEPDLPGSEGEIWISFTYDYMGRRVEKHVREFKNELLEESTTRFIYDGWNLVAEYDFESSNFILNASYVSGTDLSGTFQGAGGVGGLLKSTFYESSATSQYFLYDANGNVGQLLSETAMTVAHYEYDPFGNTSFTSGQMAETNRFRFSTKYQDSLTGLYYYGFRYYDLTTGRWPSRDPIGERGGANLYAMIGNNSVNAIDLLGLQGRSTRCKPKSGFDLEFKDFQNVSVALDDSNATPDPYMTGVPGDLFDVFFRIRGNAKVKVSCHRTKRHSDGCCKTTKASATVGPFNFDVTQSHRVSLFNPVTGLRALNLARWAARIANGVQNIPEVKAALEAKAKADEVCRRILK